MSWYSNDYALDPCPVCDVNASKDLILASLAVNLQVSNMLKLMSRLAPTPNPATGSLRATALPERPASLRMHFEHDVVLARVLDHFQAEIVVRPYLGRRRMINLEGVDLLAEIGGV